MNAHDWTTIIGALGDLIDLAAAVITLVAVLGCRDER